MARGWRDRAEGKRLQIHCSSPKPELRRASQLKGIPTYSMLHSILTVLLASSVSVAFSPSPNIGRRTSSTSSPIVLSGSKVGIFFGTSTGSTQEVADLISEEFGSDVASEPIEVDGIQGGVEKEFAKYDALCVGTPTWNTGADTERSGTGWDEIYYGEMEGLDIAGKKVAVFGLGDSVSYGENYADGAGEVSFLKGGERLFH